MTNKDFKVWLAVNEMTQDQLAKRLGITERTITTYNANNRYPLVFQYALKGLALELNKRA